MNKKGAIELSITGVIVLIIAITVLGLVLAFVSGYFEKAKVELERTFDEMKERAIKDIKERGEELSFSGGQILNVKSGVEQEEVLGIKNTGEDTVCFLVEFICKKPFKGAGCTDTLVGGESTDNKKPVKEWFGTLSKWDIGPNKVEVKPVDVKIEEAKLGKYDMILNVYKATNKKDCKQAIFGNTPWKEFTFTLDVGAD